MTDLLEKTEKATKTGREQASSHPFETASNSGNNL